MCINNLGNTFKKQAGSHRCLEILLPLSCAPILELWSKCSELQSPTGSFTPTLPSDRHNRTQIQHLRSTTSRLCQLYLPSTTAMLQPKLIIQNGTYSVASEGPNFPLHLRHPECTVKPSSYLAQIPLYLFLNKCKPHTEKSLVCALTFPAAPAAWREAAGLGRSESRAHRSEQGRIVQPHQLASSRDGCILYCNLGFTIGKLKCLNLKTVSLLFIQYIYFIMSIKIIHFHQEPQGAHKHAKPMVLV